LLEVYKTWFYYSDRINAV